MPEGGGEGFDLVVVGGGMGGLATAALAQAQGLRTALLEAHSRLGGCAGWFDRGPYTFDAGATALMGLGPGEPLGDLCAAVGLDFEGARTASYRACLPDRTVEVVPDSAAFERGCEAAFPNLGVATRTFWRWQGAVGGRLFDAAGGVPRLPLRSLADVGHNAKIFGARGLLAGATSAVTVADVLRWLGLDGDRPFRSFVAMLLQDTAQAGPEVVPFANAAACLQAYRLGLSRPRGTMKALAEGLGARFEALGGTLRASTLVDAVEARGEGFAVVCRNRTRLAARQVCFDLPLDLAARLLGRGLEGRLGRSEGRARARWGAFTGYLAFDREAVADDAPLFHQVLRDYGRSIDEGNNVLVSLSPPGDAAYGPVAERVATLSTHTRPGDWAGLDRAAYVAKKADYAERLLGALGRALPEARGRLRHAEFASPRSWQRYTRRQGGAVGGPPVTRRNSNALAVGADVFGPGLWVVGDSVFPGQGTMATVLAAVRVIERIQGEPWERLKRPGRVGGVRGGLAARAV